MPNEWYSSRQCHGEARFSLCIQETTYVTKRVMARLFEYQCHLDAFEGSEPPSMVALQEALEQ